MDPLDDCIASLSPNDTSLLIQPIMHTLSSALLLGSLALQAVLGRPNTRGVQSLQKRDIEAFIQSESAIALDLLLCNIGADGCNVKDAASGIVVASPSTEEPDYFYTWTRDSSLVFKSIIDRFTNYYDASLQKHIEQWIASAAQQQGISGPSGDLSNGLGLGEPKFEANLTAFTGSWGRPQRDGPALRAIAMTSYSNWLIENGYKSTVSDTIWPVIRNDLDYTAQYWNEKGFDLWEEVNGTSFFTTVSQHRALVEGARLASALGKSGDHYNDIAPQILCQAQGFWQSDGYIDSNINLDNDKRTGKDVNSILASIHIFDASLGCDVTTFQPCSDKALLNHKAVVDSFRVYPINEDRSKGSAAAVGRYIEDVYFNGNPWYLATLAAAEQLYDALYVWKKQGYIQVTQTSLPFFQDFAANVKPGKYSTKSCKYDVLFKAVSRYADEFVEIVQQYIGENGGMAEQFSREDGVPLSARDLTWSYAAFLTAADRRGSVIPPTWVNGLAPSVPEKCSDKSAVGSYSSATITGFPTSQTPKTGVPPPTTTNGPRPTSTKNCATATSVTVNFKERVETKFGQTIKIVGNNDALGNWNPEKAVPLDASDYTSDDPIWKAKVALKAGDNVEYKYINVAEDGSVTWERDPNHTYSALKLCATTTVRSDRWQY